MVVSSGKILWRPGSLALGQRLNLQTDEKNRVLLRLLVAAKAQTNLMYILLLVSSVLFSGLCPHARPANSGAL